jgi:hypothetical protein
MNSNSVGMGGNSQGIGCNSVGIGGNSQGVGCNSQGVGCNSQGVGCKIVIIKAGALFSISSRVGGNNDLTLDESVNVKLYKNAIVNIGGNSYIYGPVTQINPNPNPNPNPIPIPNALMDNVIVIGKGSKYHINNGNIDPIGLTTVFDIEQKVCMNPFTPIILPSETILHTLDGIMEFTLTKAVHCILA